MDNTGADNTGGGTDNLSALNAGADADNMKSDGLEGLELDLFGAMPAGAPVPQIEANATMTDQAERAQPRLGVRVPDGRARRLGP